MHNHPSPRAPIDAYQRTGWVINRQAEDLSHADSLLQLPFRGHCMNWVLGPILNGREGEENQPAGQESQPAGEESQPVGEGIAFLHGHETHHTGQLEILCQLAGTDDHIIG